MNKDDQTRICFRVDTDIAEKLKDKAKAEYLSASAYIRKCLEKTLKEELK